VAKKNGAIVVLNPAPAPFSPLPGELLKHVDILIPNQTETERLSGVTVKDDETLLQAIHRLQEMGVGQVVVTLGSRGAMTVINGQPLMVSGIKVEAVDTTAAGDTFCGALCVRLSLGSSIEEAMRFACKAASLTVTRMGAQQSIPYLSEIAAL
jgi:ribokinase